MYNVYGINTVKLDDGVKACYYIDPSRGALYATAGTIDLVPFLDAKAAETLDKSNLIKYLNNGWELFKYECPEIYESIKDNLHEPLCCSYDLYIHNNETTTFEYVVDDILMGVVNLNRKEAEKCAKEVHESGEAKVRTYCSYEIAHLYASIIQSVNAQTENILDVSVSAKYPENFYSLYQILVDENVI